MFVVPRVLACAPLQAACRARQFPSGGSVVIVAPAARYARAAALPALSQVLFFRLSHQFRSRNTQRFPEPYQCREGWLPDATLKTRHKRTINVCQMGELFLRNTLRRPVPSKGLPKNLPDVCRARHGVDRGFGEAYSPRPIGTYAGTKEAPWQPTQVPPIATR